VLTFTGWTDLAPREKKQAQIIIIIIIILIIIIMSIIKKVISYTNVRYDENGFFRNILFDASEYLFNFDLNSEFGTNKCLSF
jgi:hypothetical protein